MCATSCKTKNHKTFGECLRAQNIRVAYCGIGGGDATVQRQWDRDNEAFRSAVRQGIHPKTTNRRDVEDAVILSDATGVAHDGW